MEQQLRYTFALLSEAHDVSGFDCHNTFLSQFLKQDALFQTQNDLSRTYVLLDRKEDSAGEVIGYFTVQADSFYDSQKQNGGTIPVVLLSYLARHISRRGEGLGSLLLFEAFRLTVEAAEQVGIAGMHLSYTEEGKALYQKYGFGDHPYGTSNLFLSIKQIRRYLSED